MHYVFSSDWQAEFSNLDLCQKAADEICAILNKYDLEGFCLCGDGKQSYNPVDVRVIHFFQDFIHRVKDMGCEFIYVLGNHDRIGQYTDAQNWFPILRRAGAFCADGKYHLVKTSSGCLAILPFCSSIPRLKQRAAKLASLSNENDILVFHANLKGARYNKLGATNEEGLLYEKDLHPERYLACVGGDIHLPQKLGENIYYTGSPFCCDWGEANQIKSYFVVRENKILRVPSGIPGFFDPDWPDFPRGRRNWVRSHIRIHVPCGPGVSYSATLEKARRDAERHYAGATIYPILEFDEGPKSQHYKINTDDTDEHKIKAYVWANQTGALSVAKVVSYLHHKLMQATGGSMRRAHSTEFLWAKGKNVLSFEEVYCDFRSRGLVVVRGTNQDRAGRSNGSGKTNFLQLIPLGLFGTTFKGQKFDRWARRDSNDAARVVLGFRDFKGRIAKVKRGRNPVALSLHIGDVDYSSGMRHTGKEETQGLIEQVAGLTWQTLANAVYIDQNVTRAFLTGTKKERTAVLSKFQNLERFEAALVLVRADLRRLEHWAEDVEATWQSIKGRIAEAKEILQREKQEHRQELSTLRAQYIARKKEYTKELIAFREWYNKQHEQQKEIEDAVAAYNSKIVKVEELSRQAEEVLSRDTYELGRLEKLVENDTCPTCGARVDHKEFTKQILLLKRGIRLTKQEIENTREKRRKLLLKAQLLEGEHDEIELEINRREDALSYVRNHRDTLQQRYSELKARRNNHRLGYHDTERRIRDLRKRKEYFGEVLEDIEKQVTFYQYAVKAFSRDGIPSFLNAQLCPTLNKAADYYAELFTDRAIQLRFIVEEGEFDVQVVNASGGAEIGDQSTGERALAGLIASFALREVAPRCNLLVLDEPGEGLDEGNARQFARALRTLARTVGSVFITSHNVHILSELAEEETITIEKSKGISHVR